MLKKNPYLTTISSGVSQSFVNGSDVYNLNYPVLVNNQLDAQFFMYQAYSESKYRLAVKKLIKFSYNILLLSGFTFFKLFFHTFAAIIEALNVAEHKFLYTLLIECGRLRC